MISSCALYFALMVFVLLYHCKEGWTSSIKNREKVDQIKYYFQSVNSVKVTRSDGDVVFDRNYTGVYFDPGNFLKFNGIPKALDESGFHPLLHKIHSRFDQIMVPFHFPPPFDERLSNDFVPEAVATYNSAMNESLHSPNMKIIIWCRVHDWSNVKMIHSRIQRLRSAIASANRLHSGTVKSVILELNMTDASSQNYAMFRNSFFFCNGTVVDQTVKFGIQFVSTSPKNWEGLKTILNDSHIATAYISEYENGQVSRDASDTVVIFMNHFSHYKQLAKSLNKTIEMGIITSWPDTDDIGQVKYAYLVDFWRRMDIWAGKSKVPLTFRQAFDTPLSDELNSRSDGWWRHVPNSSYDHPSQFSFVEKLKLDGMSEENRALNANLTWLRSETQFSRDHIGVGFSPNVFRPVVGKPELYIESSIHSLMRIVSSKFSKIFISATRLSESDDGYWIPSVTNFNGKGDKTMEVVMTFDEFTLDHVIKWSIDSNQNPSLTVKHLCYSPGNFSVDSIADSLLHIVRNSTELKRFRLGIKVSVEICNDWTKFVNVMRVVHSYFTLVQADAIYIDSTPLTSELTKLGVDRAFPMITGMFENCVNEVAKYFGYMTRNVQVIFITGWTVYDGGRVDDLLQFVRFWEQMSDWAVRSNTTVFFSSAFDIQTIIDQEVGSTTTYGWWRLVQNDTFPETVEDFIFEDKKQVALRLAESKLSDKSVDQNPDPSSRNILVISVTIPIFAALLVTMLTICFFLKSRYSNNLTKSEIAKLFNGRGTDDVLGNEESIKKINKIAHHELSRKWFAIDEESPPLGSGKFGKVCHGTVTIAATGEQERVAVKMANKVPCPTTTLRGLMFELKMLSFLGKHPHIVEIIGACTSELKNRRIFIVLELCALGSLKSFLRNCKASVARRSTRGNVLDDSNSEPGPSWGSSEAELDESLVKDLHRWAVEIASLMEFIASQFIVHLDIATRNILLTAEKRAKITDFGLSRQLYDCQTYVKQEKEPLPWRWMAPESLRSSTFTEKSDVWSFGVLLWEIYSLGGEPYHPLQSFDLNFLSKLEKGLILNEPIYNRGGMYLIMRRCWEIEPERRPKFSELVDSLCPIVSQRTGDVEANDETQQPTFLLPPRQVNKVKHQTTCVDQQERSNIRRVRFVWLSVAIILLVMLLSISITAYYGHRNVGDDDRTNIPNITESVVVTNLTDKSRTFHNDTNVRNNKSKAVEFNGFDMRISEKHKWDLSTNETESNVNALADVDPGLNICHNYNDSDQLSKPEESKHKILGRKMFSVIDRQDEAAIKFLLMLGGDINVENDFSQTPLIRAAEGTQNRENKSGGLNIIKYLIENGADGHALSKTGTFFHSLVLSNLTSTEFDDITTYLLLKNMSYVFNTQGGPVLATPLQLAVMNFEVDAPMLLMFFQNGVNFNITDGHGNSILTYLVSAKRNVTLLSCVLEFGVNVNHLNKYHQSALHHAAQFGPPNSIKYLVELKLNINAQDNAGRTPLHLAVMSLIYRPGNILETVRVLVEHGAKGTIKDHQGSIPLDWILGINNVPDKDKIIQLIENAMGLEEDLLTAIAEKDEDSVVKHLKRGADVNHKYNTWRTPTPLIAAAYCDGDKSICLKIIKHLVESGADVYAKDSQNRTFLHALVSPVKALTPSEFHDITSYIISKNMSSLFNERGYISGSYPLQVALMNFEINVATLSLLHENGVSFNVVDLAIGYSVLMFALVGNQSIECISRLVTLGADVNKLNAKNQSCLHVAAVMGSVDHIDYFLQHNLSINAQDVDGMTPLHSATYIARKESIRERVTALTQNGANVTIKDRFGAIPLDYAKTNEYIMDQDDLLQLLSDVG